MLVRMWKKRALTCGWLEYKLAQPVQKTEIPLKVGRTGTAIAFRNPTTRPMGLSVLSLRNHYTRE